MRALYICGSINQTKMLHQISLLLPQFEAVYTPYYCDGYLNWLEKTRILDFCVIGTQGKFFRRTMEYLRNHQLPIDYKGTQGPYDLVITCSDIVIPKNILGAKTVLVQEGMTDPESIFFYLVKYLNFPRWTGKTSVTGMSDAYDIFCVASEGYWDLFAGKGVKPEKMRLTGIPNFDNCAQYLENDFPYRDYVLVATSDIRETFGFENRRKFIERARRIAGDRQLIFKLHPNETLPRAVDEIKRYAPEALYFTEGNCEHMIANCSVLIARYSSVVYVAQALGKEIHSDLTVEQLARLMPIQNGGRSAANIAAECLKLFA